MPAAYGSYGAYGYDGYAGCGAPAGDEYGTVPTTLPAGRPLFRDEEPWPGI
ncbi:hypothetical protein ACIQI8_33825 [Streptomyces sp. NPDC092369]|uniref:hypothetical protein n=1 Tax=Streptomyces sp. NPDC092369 TaxID=3366015 RepID=UPI0037F47AA9